MPGLDPGIHVIMRANGSTWMAGSSPAMTAGGSGDKMQDDKGNPPAARAMLYPAVVAGMLTLLYVSSFIDRNILSQLVKPIRMDIGLTDTEYSYLSGLAFVVFYTAIGIPLGRIADRGSRNIMVSIG